MSPWALQHRGETYFFFFFCTADTVTVPNLTLDHLDVTVFKWLFALCIDCSSDEDAPL